MGVCYAERSAGEGRGARVGVGVDQDRKAGEVIDAAPAGDRRREGEGRAVRVAGMVEHQGAGAGTEMHLTGLHGAGGDRRLTRSCADGERAARAVAPGERHRAGSG